jgi:hypothetical protein
MTIFDGTYRWDGTKKDNLEPIAWYPGAYNLKIYPISQQRENVDPLKTCICVYAGTGEGCSISVNPEKFAQRICIDFHLDIDRVLWVEDLLREHNRYEVVTFFRTRKIGTMHLYRSEKRLPLAGEMKMIKKVQNRA